MTSLLGIPDNAVNWADFIEEMENAAAAANATAAEAASASAAPAAPAASAANDSWGSCLAVRNLFAAAAAAGGSTSAAPAAAAPASESDGAASAAEASDPAIKAEDLEKELKDKAEATTLINAMIALYYEMKTAPEWEKDFLEGIYDRWCEDLAALPGGYNTAAELRKHFGIHMSKHNALQEIYYLVQKARYENIKALSLSTGQNQMSQTDKNFIAHYKALSDCHKQLWAVAFEARTMLAEIIEDAFPDAPPDHGWDESWDQSNVPQ